MALLDASVEAAQPIQPDEVEFHLPPKEAAALHIVLGDFNKADTWLESKQWALRWRESQLRYEPIRQVNYWEGTTVPRSSLNVYTVAQVVQSIMAKIMEGIFSDDPPFVIIPRKGTGAEESRAVGALLNYQIEDCDFRQEIEDGAADAILFGTSIWKANWQECKKKRRFYKRKEAPVHIPGEFGGDGAYLDTEESDDIVAEVKEVDHGRPVLELQDLYTTYVDPSCRRSDIRKAKFVISRITVSAEELDDMRDWEGYDIPSEEKLRAVLFPREETVPATQMDSQETVGTSTSTHQAQPRWMEQTVDPIEDTSRFEILERWDNDRVIAVLNRKLVIRNEENPFGRLPYFSVGWWRVPNSFYSMGVGITAGDEQEIQRGIINARLDEVAWNVNLPILVDKNENLLTQNIRMSLGKFVRVDDIAKSMKQMERLQAIPEAYAEVQASQARVEGSSGANEMLVQGATPAQGRTSLTRTATGANLLAGGSGARLEAFVQRLSNQVIIPTLDMFFEMDKQLLEMEQLREILDDEMFSAYTGDAVKLLNARVKFDVEAASSMGARQRMAQSLPMMAQTFLTDPMHQMLQAQGKKLNVDELANMWFQISGWKNKSSLIVDMTPEDQQRAAMENPAVQKMMADKANIAAQTQSKLQIQDSDNAARAYREVNRQVIQSELKRMAILGEPNPSMLDGPGV